jgi:radical SAM superfamily enzyme YgiQ (UPF0313 family)
MKLKLISPKSRLGEQRYPFPPYPLMVIAGLTPKDIEVVIEDESVEDLNFDEPVDIVGITVLTATAKNSFRIADRYREKGVKVLMGGMFVEACPDECLKHADTVVLGEVDDIWESILNDFKMGCMKQRYEALERPDIGNRPLPRYDLICGKHGYFTPNIIVAVRGCPHKCEFCSCQVHWKGKVKTRPVADVIREIKSFDLRFPLAIADDNLVGDKNYAKELFKALIPLKLKWYGFGASIDMVEDLELMQLAMESGCQSQLVGLETVNQKALNKASKGFNKVENYYRAIEIFHKYGIAMLGVFLFGLDEDTEENFRETVEFVEKSKIDMVQFNIIYPYPGTPYRDFLEGENRLLSTANDWDKHGLNNVLYMPKKMNSQQLLDGYEWACKEVLNKGKIAERVAECIKGNRDTAFVLRQNMGFRKMAIGMFGEGWD